MKKICLLLMAIVLIIIVSIFRYKFVSINPKNIESESLTIMYEGENEVDNYKQWQGESWPQSDDNYFLNTEKSKCTNGANIYWQEESSEIISDFTEKNSKCTAYFDQYGSKYVKDLSGKGNYGKISGAKLQDDGELNGDENAWYGYVDCGLPKYNFGSSITLVIRVKANKVDGIPDAGMGLIGNTEGGGGELNLQKNGTFSFLLRVTPSMELRSSSTINVIKDKWYTVVGTYDGQKQVLYVDGQMSGSREGQGEIRLSNFPFLIGATPENSNNSYVPGFKANITVSDALIYDRAVTAEEVQSNFSSEINNVNKDQLLFWYKFTK